MPKVTAIWEAGTLDLTQFVQLLGNPGKRLMSDSLPDSVQPLHTDHDGTVFCL